jgi:hypothetical protein
MAGLTVKASKAASLNFQAFAWRYWKVLSKAGRRVPFEPNAAQRLIETRRMCYRRRGKQFRAKILKYRQAGVSTYLSGLMQFMAQTQSGFLALSIADKQDLPEQWLRRAKRWYHQTPSIVRPHLQASNSIELYYDKSDSRYFIGSSEGKTPGMGYTIRGLHASEIASWSSPTGIFDNLLPAIPKDDPTAIVVYESTGEMEGDWWHKAWWASKKKEDDFEAIFLPWSLQEEYRMDPADIRALAVEEQELVRSFKLGTDQLAWRRWTIRNEFEGDVERFRNKYPLLPEEAFLGVGKGVVSSDVIRRHASTVTAPIGKFQLVARDGHIAAAEYHGSEPHWEIWNMPDDSCDYTVGGDVAEGKPSDPSNERSERDWSAAMVLNRRRLRFDAQFRGQVPPDMFGREMRKAAMFYHRAFVTPEVNSAGWATLVELKGYPRLFIRDGAQDEIEDHELGSYGWKTTQDNRNWLIDNYLTGCRPDPFKGFEDKLVNPSRELLEEEKTFIYNRQGKREHASGCHDDMMFAAMIAYMLHVTCPRTWTPPIAQYELVSEVRKGPNQIGGMDSDFEYESDEYWYGRDEST